MGTNESLRAGADEPRIAFYIGDVAMEAACANDGCVAAGEMPDGNILLGDTKDPSAQPLVFSRQELVDFSRSVVAGCFRWATQEQA